MILQYLDGVIALILLVAGAVTIWAARKRGRSQLEIDALANAQAAVEMMKVQIQSLKDNLEGKVVEQQQMIARIDVLESLVSQRYDLSQIQEDLAYVKEKVSELA